MNVPKRHHWWPQLNSGHWCNVDSKINVLNRDGSSFLGKPRGLGVVGQLYSKELSDGSKDVSIETWFANDVDGPFDAVLRKLIDEQNVAKRKIRSDPEKAKVVRSLGYRITDYVEYIRLSDHEREVLSRYVAALLVRNPGYLEKLEVFHSEQLKPRNHALDNMKHIFDIYANRIFSADFIVIKRDADNEFIFSDGGIVAREPWSKSGGIPFDIHYPMTPDYALQVLPAIKQEFRGVHLFRASNTGISAHNRISLQHAKRQVFGRAPLPTKFVLKNWGRPAPQHIGFRHVDGKLETKIDWSRFNY
ncbi:DUF4238 domain-containing protein [Mesobaculum littorinae]|uniref:DUF4238 domain-containing protein n=1 Tax=Mesobaculum littorinae TaxID=2486419 RepID=A0A438AD28_9RHOB|nr:DUF4238 domain-containing protein [Mesobaculum littorinae]RVV96611.1 DUF4238 domain-containing protein [Mesobaculum littorinae]